MEQAVIPVVLACNDNYAPYCSVAIQSIKETAKSNAEYRVYVLQDRLSPANIAKLEGMSEGQLRVECKNVADLVQEDAMYPLSELSRETYYRLMIPDLFPQYQRVLYLDCDLVVLGDIAPLFALDMGDAILGAVSEYLPHMDDIVYQPWFENFNAVTHRPKSQYNTYFNAGVLLIQCERYREMRVFERSMEFLKSHPNLKFLDQDTLNVIAYPYVLYLDPKWNYWRPIETTRVMRTAQKTLAEIRACDAVILHFVVQKPWKSLSSCFSVYFWDYAKRCPYAQELLESFVQDPCQMVENSAPYGVAVHLAYTGNAGLRSIFMCFARSLRGWASFKLHRQRKLT